MIDVRNHNSIFENYEVNTTHNPLVEIKNVVKSYQELDVLKGVNINVRQGETIVIIGPSGGGKSTLLRCIHTLTSINHGEIWVDGVLMGYKKVGDKMVRLSEVKLAKQRVHIGMVFQDFNLFPHFTVINNIMEAPIRVKKVKKDQAHQDALELLRAVGLESKADEYPSQLSGGQQQRVAIARALAMKPKLMLYDEATSALDIELIGEVLAVIESISEAGMTSIVVTHEMSFAKKVADTLYILDAGRVLEYGPPLELINNPKEERTKIFLQNVTQEYFISKLKPKCHKSKEIV